MATTISSASSSGPLASAGIGSGLPIDSIVSKLMAVEQMPLTSLQTKEASYQAKLSAYGALTGSVSSLQSAVDALKSSTLYSKLSATSSDSTILSATANSAASTGSHSINVVTLASAQTLTSQVFSSASTAVNTSAGQMKFELGTYNSSTSTFTADSSRSAVTVNIAANSSLSSIRDQINAANAGVTAKLVSVDAAGTQFKLSITSNTTGANGSLRITTMDANGNVLNNNTDLAKLSYDPTKTSGTGNEYAVAAAAQDAHIQVDGVDLYRNSNTIGDAITGVSMTLTKAGTSALTVGTDTSALQSAVQSFVTAYNSTVSMGRQLTNYNSSTKTAAILTGDSAARGLLSQLSNMVTLGGPNSTSASVRGLSDLGISLQKDGSLSLDTLKLQSVLNTNLPDVKTMLSSTDTSLSAKGVAVQISSRLGNILDSRGLLASSTSGIQSTIDSLTKQQDALKLRLTQVQANYQKQFTALDSLVASMQSTQSYLTTQLAQLSKLNSSG